MKDCILCGRTVYNYFGESICAVCKARKEFEEVQAEFNRGKVAEDVYTYYLNKFNQLLKG